MRSRRLPLGCGVTLAALALAGCGGDGTSPGAAPRLGTPVAVEREAPAPATRATKAPTDNVYDESFEKHGNPTAQEQLMLELINRARRDPEAEGDRLNITPDIYEGVTTPSNIIPRGPLAFNGRLIAAARLHSQDMINRSFFDHVNPDGDDPGDRITAQGYTWNSYAENIAYGYGSPEAHHNAYIIDTGISGRGHRVNCLGNGNVVEIGIGYINSGGGYSTEDFGRRSGFDSFIVGVVYDDQDADDFYDIGEGIADVTVMPDAGDWHAISSDSGGYAIPITMTGTVTLTFTYPAAYSNVTHVTTIDVDDPLQRKADSTIQQTGIYGSITFSSTAYSEIEDAGTATITVKRTDTSFGPVSVEYQVTEGTATDGSDFDATSGTLDWADGDMTDKTFTVTLHDDSTAEGAETVSLAISNPGGGATLGAVHSATLTIVDDDSAGSLAFTAATATVGEEDGSITLTVSRTGGSDGAVGVSYATGNGTAVDGSDYTADSGTLSWADGNTADRTITITILDADVAPEADEFFTVALSSPTGGVSVGTPSSVTVTIVDDDWPGTIQFVSTAESVTEGNAGPTTVTLQATRTGGRRGAASVQVDTHDGAASEGSDYTAITSGTVTWADDEDGPKDITVTVQGDTDLELDEDFTVALSNATTAGLGTATVATVTILEDEVDSTQPGLTVTTPSAGEATQGDVVISGTANDNLAVASIEISVDGGAPIVVPGVTVGTPVTWSYTLATYDLPNGDHDITVTVTDYQGLTSDQTVTVTVENEVGLIGANGVGGCAPAGGGGVALSVLVALGLCATRRRRS